jgi:hypothetical protein
MPLVASEDIRAFRPLCSQLARKHTGRFGAEFDDLEQEGMIAVFHLLLRGLPVTSESIDNRMRDWVRQCRRAGVVYDRPKDEDS